MPGKDKSGKDRPAPDLSRSLRYVVIYLCLAVAMLLSGLQHFVLTLPSASGKQLQYTDGIVVMTGGQQRLDDGLYMPPPDEQVAAAACPTRVGRSAAMGACERYLF